MFFLKRDFIDLVSQKSSRYMSNTSKKACRLIEIRTRPTIKPISSKKKIARISPKLIWSSAKGRP